MLRLVVNEIVITEFSCHGGLGWLKDDRQRFLQRV